MYQTRFVYQLPLERAGDVAAHVASTVSTTSVTPSNVRVLPDGDMVFATITYYTDTVTESENLIKQWRQLDMQIQVERVHKLDYGQIETLIRAGRNGRAFRSDLARNVVQLCNRGIGSKGVIEYLEECREIIDETIEYVEEQRAPN